MKELFDFLAKNRLVNDHQIESTIMHDWSMKDIIDFNDRLCEKIEPHPAGSPDITSFQFIANSSLSGQKRSDCQMWNCRVSKADNLARFASLYSDRIYIPNYFDQYIHLWEELPETHARYLYAGDLKVLLTLKPLIENGIIYLINSPDYHFCPDCLSKMFPELAKSIHKLSDSILSWVKSYTKKSSANVLLDEVDLGSGTCSIVLKAPDDILEHGFAAVVNFTMSKWLLKKVKLAIEQQEENDLILSTKELFRLGLLQRQVETRVHDVFFQQFCSKILGLNAKYITDRDADILVMNTLNEDEEFQHYSEVLQNKLLYELPILQRVPLKMLLEVRAKDHDAFLTYRNTIKHIINEYIAKRKPISTNEAQQIYEDLIHPKLCELNSKINSIKSTARKKLARDAIIITSTMGIGLYTGFIPEQIRAITAGFSSIPVIKDIANLACQSIGIPQEIRSDNFYYLWKLSKKQR